jgi:acyl-homoserine lactone acylase PvdQ
LFTIYQPIPTGKSEIFLSKATGSSTIIKEEKYGTSHIYADTMEMAIYTQGYLHA